MAGAFQQLLGQTAGPPYLEIPSFQVIERSLFRADEGYCGWVEHGAVAASPPLSLTRYPSLSGSNSLMICTGPGTATTHTGTTNAIKRMSRPRPEEGQLHWKLWWAFRAEQIAQNPRRISFLIDTQLGDNSQRSEVEVVWIRRQTASPYNVTNRFYVANNARELVGVPECEWNFGENENKADWSTIELVFNYNPTAVLEYTELIVQGKAYDLEGIGGQQGRQTPQTTSSFANGFNIGIAVTNRNDAAYGPAEVFLGRSETWLVA